MAGIIPLCHCQKNRGPRSIQQLQQWNNHCPFHSDSSHPSLNHKQSAVTFQKKKPPSVSNWKVSPINHWVMTDYLNCVIVHTSAWRALTSEDTGSHTDVTVWKGAWGIQMPGRINSPPAMTATRRRRRDPQPESCPRWLVDVRELLRLRDWHERRERRERKEGWKQE